MKFYFAFLYFLIIPLTVFPQYTETINSNRPGNSQGAFSVGTGVIQIETGAEMGKDQHKLLNTESDLWGVNYSLRYGFLMEQLEVSLTGSFLSTTVEFPLGASRDTYNFQNFDSNTIGAKYLLFDPYKSPSKEPNLYSWKANQRFDWSQLIPAVSLFAGANFVLQDENPYLEQGEAKFSPKVGLITQNNFKGGWVLVLNAIADRIEDEYPAYIGIVSLTHSFNQNLAGFAEFQTISSDKYSDELIRGGLAYLLNKNLQLDISGLANFKDTPSRWQVELGFSFRIDRHTRDEILDDES